MTQSFSLLTFISTQPLISLRDCSNSMTNLVSTQRLYPLALNDNSSIRERLMTSLERFIDAESLSDDQIANLAKSLEIDILVDLNGFTKDSRTNVSARRPAPIQVS
jgi:hypothetical protein